MKGFNKCPHCGALKVAVQKTCKSCKGKTIVLGDGFTPKMDFGPDIVNESGTGWETKSVGEATIGQWTAAIDAALHKVETKPKTENPQTSAHCQAYGHTMSKGNTKAVCIHCAYWEPVDEKAVPMKDPFTSSIPLTGYYCADCKISVEKNHTWCESCFIERLHKKEEETKGKLLTAFCLHCSAAMPGEKEDGICSACLTHLNHLSHIADTARSALVSQTKNGTWLVQEFEANQVTNYYEFASLAEAKEYAEQLNKNTADLVSASLDQKKQIEKKLSEIKVTKTKIASVSESWQPAPAQPQPAVDKSVVDKTKEFWNTAIQDAVQDEKVHQKWEAFKNAFGDVAKQAATASLKTPKYPQIPVPLTEEEKALAIGKGLDQGKIPAIKKLRERFPGPYLALNASSKINDHYYYVQTYPNGFALSLVDAKASVEAFLDEYEAAQLMGCGNCKADPGKACALHCSDCKLNYYCPKHNPKEQTVVVVEQVTTPAQWKTGVEAKWPDKRSFGKMAFSQISILDKKTWAITDQAGYVVCAFQMVPNEDDVMSMLLVLNASRLST